MKFEEILPLLREGKKARNPRYEADSVLIAVYEGLDPGIFKEFKAEPVLSLAYVNKEGKLILDRNSWALPRWLLMCDQWEIVE